MIALAKLSFRAYLAGTCGFPDGVEGMQEAKECLEDAIEVHLDDGGTLEPGKCYRSSRRSSTHIQQDMGSIGICV